jgi:hypothetical protein
MRQKPWRPGRAALPAQKTLAERLHDTLECAEENEHLQNLHPQKTRLD